jgi:hypothetical protein
MAAGPRADVLRGTTTPSAQDIGACIAEAKAANPTMIVPFQVRGSINPNDVNSFYGHSYGLIDDSTGAPRSDYLAAIQAAV